MEARPDDERPPIGLLIKQLADDAQHFARAETAFLKASVGERWSYALPAFIMIGAGIALALGGLIALPVGLMFILEAYVGRPLAVLIVVAGSILIALAGIKFGIRRLKAALKSPEER